MRWDEMKWDEMKWDGIEQKYLIVCSYALQLMSVHWNDLGFAFHNIKLLIQKK